MTVADRTASEVGRDVVRPFAGMLVTPDWAERVVSPMLDAVSPEVHAELLETRADSWLHVAAGTAGRGETAASDAGQLGADHLSGAAALQRLIDAGAFAPQPAGLFAYRIDDGHGVHTGLVGDVAAQAFVSGQVRGHEGVQPDRVEAVLRYFTSVPARTELVALLRPPDPEVDAIVARTCVGDPLLDFGTTGDFRQTIWRVADEEVAGLTARLGSHPLYVADGHHRVAASLRAWEGSGRPRAAGIPCVLYSPDGLRLESFHRRVRGPVDHAALAGGLRDRVKVRETEGPCPQVGTVAAYVSGRWLALTLAEPGLESEPAGVAALDVARLHVDVLEPLLGIVTTADPRLEVIPATDPLTGLTGRCDADGGALFVLAAPSIAQVIQVADRREVMLPKATFFEPKPQAGIFLELVDA